MGRALLMNWFDMVDGAQAQFETWHNREHVIERVSVPGFLMGRRYESCDPGQSAGHDYFAIYDATDLSVFASPAYGERLDNPTPLTRAAVPLLRGMTRTACDVRAEFGRGVGPHLCTLRLPALSPRLDADASLLDGALEAAYACQGVVKVQLGKPDAAVTHYKDRTQEGRSTQTLVRAAYPWTVVIEAASEHKLDAATQAFCQALRAQLGDTADADLVRHRYRLVLAMAAEPGA